MSVLVCAAEAKARGHSSGCRLPTAEERKTADYADRGREKARLREMRAKRKVKDVGKEETRAFLDVGGSSGSDDDDDEAAFLAAAQRVRLVARRGVPRGRGQRAGAPRAPSRPCASRAGARAA